MAPWCVNCTLAPLLQRCKSRWQEAARALPASSPAQLTQGKGSHRKHPTVYLPPWRVRGVTGPGGGHSRTSHHLEYITAAVTN